MSKTVICVWPSCPCTAKGQCQGTGTRAALEAAPVPDLVEAGKVLEGVTPGPWKANYSKWEPSNFIVQTDHPCRRVLAKFDGDGDGPDAQSIADARFIAWCREGVPALIALATAQAAQIAGLTRGLTNAQSDFTEQLGKATAYEFRMVDAEAEVERLRGAMARIEKAWPLVRDTDCTGGELASAIDEIDAALEGKHE